MRKDKSFSESFKDWVNFVNIRIEIFCMALNLLQVTEKTKENEIEISKALYPKLRTACFQHKENPEMPKPNAEIGAVTDDELLDESIGKKPDFSYSMVNPLAESEKDYEINLHIECKCIGYNRSPSWNLNMNYITDGISRFDYLSHKYGKGANDGIMIGYIISSTKYDIQEIINQKLPKNIEELNFKTRNKVENITTKFERENVEPFDFKLHHIWADFTLVDNL
jgi:hypothetical protein